MCNTSNSPSFSERVQCYINKEKEIKNNYKNSMNALYEEACADILANCPIKVGDVYTTEIVSAWGSRLQYYKVAKLEPSIDGTVIVYGYKRKLDKTWGKRDNIYMFNTSMCNNYNPTNNYTKVEDYVEPSKY